MYNKILRARWVPTLMLLVGHTVLQQSASAGQVWTVDDSGGSDFLNLQQAINAASSGDKILVMPGDYSRITIDKPLHILGAGAQEVRIKSTEAGLAAVSISVADAGEVFLSGVEARAKGKQGGLYWS